MLLDVVGWCDSRVLGFVDCLVGLGLLVGYCYLFCFAVLWVTCVSCRLYGLRVCCFYLLAGCLKLDFVFADYCGGCFVVCWGVSFLFAFDVCA